MKADLEMLCPGRDLNPHAPYETQDFKSCASADFATWAAWCLNITVSKVSEWSANMHDFCGICKFIPQFLPSNR